MLFIDGNIYNNYCINDYLIMQKNDDIKKYISTTYLKGANMKQEELQNRIDNALELDDLLSLPRGFHVAENVFGQEMYIWRETVGEGYSLMFRTHNKNELYIEDFNEDGQLINCRYEEVELD